MGVERLIVRAVLATGLVAVAASGCGGGEGPGPEGGERAGAGGIGQARLAAKGNAGDLLRRPVAPRDGVAEGEPPARSTSPPAAVGTDARRCSGGALEPSRENLGGIADATLCLLNVERAGHGLRPLRQNARLRSAAMGHSRDMVRRSYFAHASRSGSTFIDRIRRTRYTSGAAGWLLGENLAWGGGPKSTPREIVDAWMNSPPHRANILQGRFREIGIGIVLGSPVGSSRPPAATYTTNFGARRRAR